ncbi:hypothetical protein [uncultured Sphingomonas sp.]|uniref:hypothetical protein n=1 Tax=uncultured Sphingomonas sp. TaxID=158754 RepID=UPI002611A7CD|nr:hypothetical protein [uncultured Sphingomonas sp.]
MPISNMAALADIVLGDAEALARAYHEITVQRLGDFESEDARRRCAIAVRAVGMAADPDAYSTAYARIAGRPTAPSKPPVTLVCNRCGSADVVRDACAQWDEATQQWELAGVYDSTTCQTCSAESDDLCAWVACVPTPPSPIPVCRRCGSDRIVRDAGVRWDARSGQWVLVDLDDCAFCEACEEEGDLLVRWSSTDAPESATSLEDEPDTDADHVIALFKALCALEAEVQRVRERLPEVDTVINRGLVEAAQQTVEAYFQRLSARLGDG